MTDVYVGDDKAAKQIEKIMRTENAEAALQAFQQCAKQANPSPGSMSGNYAASFTKLKQTLKDDGALETLSLQWAKDHENSLFAGQQKIMPNDLSRILAEEQLIASSTNNTNYNPDTNADAIMAANLSLQTGKNGLDIKSIDQQESTQLKNFISKGGGVPLNDATLAAKLFLDDTSQPKDKAKLFNILAMASGHTDGRIENWALKNFIDKATKDPTYLTDTLGYTPEQAPNVLKAVQTVYKHYGDYRHGNIFSCGSFNSTELGQGLGFAGAKDMLSTFRTIDSNSAEHVAAQPKKTEPKIAVPKPNHPVTTQNETTHNETNDHHDQHQMRVGARQHHDPHGTTVASGEHRREHHTEVARGNTAHDKSNTGSGSAGTSDLAPIPTVQPGEGYYQVSKRWLEASNIDASDAQIMALTRALLKANNYRKSLRVGETLIVTEPVKMAMGKPGTPDA